MYHLVVDSDDLNRLVIKVLLEKNGYIVDDAHDGQTAIDMIRQNPTKYNIVWLDIHMSCGIKCAETVKNEFDGYIIGTTSHTDPEIEEECRQAGIKNVILKPITEKMLLDHIEIASSSEEQEVANN